MQFFFLKESNLFSPSLTTPYGGVSSINAPCFQDLQYNNSHWLRMYLTASNNNYTVACKFVGQKKHFFNHQQTCILLQCIKIHTARCNKQKLFEEMYLSRLNTNTSYMQVRLPFFSTTKSDIIQVQHPDWELTSNLSV